MKIKLILSIMLAIVFGASVYTQSSIPNGLNVNRLPLGAKYGDVIKKLGKPTREVTSRKISECIGSRTRTVNYPGLTIELVEGDNNIFTVYAFEIRSGNWNVSGTKIGDTSANVERLFGTRGRTVEKSKIGQQWAYD